VKVLTVPGYGLVAVGVLIGAWGTIDALRNRYVEQCVPSPLFPGECETPYAAIRAGIGVATVGGLMLLSNHFLMGR